MAGWQALSVLSRGPIKVTDARPRDDPPIGVSAYMCIIRTQAAVNTRPQQWTFLPSHTIAFARGLLPVSQPSLLLTPPPDGVPKSPQGTSKRKRAMSLPSNVSNSHPERSNSPKRRRTDGDDIRPEQSASQFGSEASLALNQTITFSPPPSRVHKVRHVRRQLY
jgi:hypothetical protein